MKIAVFGSGGVGGYFGGRLAAAGHDVTFIARGAHLAAMQADGLRITSPKHGDAHVARVKATDQVASIGPVDIVLFTVKLYDVEAAAATLAPLIGNDTAVITLQNGVEAMDMVSRHVGAEHVAGGVAYVAAVIDAPGHIRHTTFQQLIFGERDRSSSPRLAAFADACNGAGFQGTLSPRIETDLWVKFVRLATWSGTTAVTRSPMGVLREDPALLALMRDALEEVMAVGRARGIAFPPTLVDDTMGMVAGFPPGTKSSLLEDLERGRRLELPWLSGAVSRIGRELGVATPIHTFIATVLAPHVNGKAA